MARSQEDFEDEIRVHLELEAERLRAQGIAPHDAELTARRNFGNVSIAGDRFHEARRFSWLFDLGTDLKRAARTLAHTPGFSIAIVLTLALGIGANSAMFSIVNAVLFRPLPYPESHRIVSLSQPPSHDFQQDRGNLGDRPYRAIIASPLTSLESVAIADEGEPTVRTASGPERMTAGAVSAGYFDVMGSRPILGRTFAEAEARVGGPNVVVLSEQMWRSMNGGNPNVLGTNVVINGKPHAVLGVMPAAFTSMRGAQFWTPYRLGPPEPNGIEMLAVLARMRRGATIDQVKAELSTIVTRESRSWSWDKEASSGRKVQRFNVITLHQKRFGDSRRALLLLFSTVGVLLLIACANLANLSLARAIRREREFAVRRALGASRGRIIRYVLCESLLLSAVGALAGAALAAASVGWLVRISPGKLANLVDVPVDAQALGFTLTVAVLTALLFGIAPALRAARSDVALTIASGTPHAAGSRRERFVRGTLIVAQLATALVMLTGAALVTKTLARVIGIETGFVSDHLMVVRPALGDDRLSPVASAAFYDNLMRRLRALPGVKSVGLGEAAPLWGAWSASFSQDPKTGKRSPATYRVAIDTSFLQTVGAKLVAGRWFNSGDIRGAPKVAIVNQTVARTFSDDCAIGECDAKPQLGRTVNLDGRVMVVGIIADITQGPVEDEAKRVVYVPHAQSRLHSGQSVVVRTTRPPAEFYNSVRVMVRELDPGQAAPLITTTEERASEQLMPRRFTVALLGSFAGLAAILAIVGLYGVLSYLVAQRTREIGVRVTLGATSWRVLRLIMGNGLRLAAVGVALGIIGAYFAVHLLRELVYDMSVYDPWMFGASAGLLVLVALVASYLPARRAARIDPVSALRME